MPYQAVRFFGTRFPAAVTLCCRICPNAAKSVLLALWFWRCPAPLQCPVGAAVCACVAAREICAEVTTSISPVDTAALSTCDVVHVLDSLQMITHLKFIETESTFDYFQATREYLDGRAHAHSTPVTFYGDKRGVFRVDTADAVRGDGRAPTSSRVSQLLHNPVWSYRLRDRDLKRVRFDDPVTWITQRQLGSMTISNGGDRFAAQIDVGGGGIDGYCFSAMLDGHARLVQSGTETTWAGANGIVFRATPGTRLLASDSNARENLWIEASTLDHALENMLGDRLREPLAFKPGFDWTGGLAASLRGQIDFLMHEIRRRGGVGDNPVALASQTDLVMSLVLRGVPHNYLERLVSGRFGAVPAYVRRAEDFMRANAAVPVRMEDVAAAACCSVRTLGAVFRRFRDTTPLAALHDIRLEQVHAELKHAAVDCSTADVARRYGFTNPGRFTAAYRRRFGETPAETAKHGSHSCSSSTGVRLASSGPQH
jgi:AraC-like DNA-binding protein